MRKLLIALPFVVTASWAGTTLYGGSQTREAYDDLIAQLDAISGPATGLRISTESYTSGFAASSAVTQVRAFDAPDAPVLFRLHHEISHSPVGLGDGGARIGAARIVTTLVTDDMDEEARTALDDLFAGRLPITLESDVGFDGRVSNVLDVAPIALEEDGVAFELGAIRYEVDIGTNGSVAGSGTFAGASLAFTDEGGTVTLSPGTDRLALERVGEGIYTGEHHMTFGTLVIEKPALDRSATLADIRYSSSSSLDADQFASGVTFAVGRIESPLPLDSLSAGVHIGGIDAGAMESFVRAMGDPDSIDPASIDPDALDPDALALEELFRKLGEPYLNLIAPGLSVDGDVALSNAGGDVTASASLLFEGDGSASGHDSMTTVRELIRALRLSATLEADVDAIAMTPAAKFVADDALAPWLLSDGVTYRSDLGIDDLIIDINGNPMSLEIMLGEMLDMPLDPSMLMTMGDR